MGARTSVVIAIKAVLIARKAASPTLLRANYNAMPGAFPELPCSFIAGRDEDITYSAQTRNRQFSGLEVVLVDSLIDNIETADRLDVLVDLLADDYWAAAPFYSGGGQLQLGSIRDRDVILTGPNGAVNYRGVTLNFGNPASPTFVREGGP